MGTILVTGGAGYIGSHVIKQLGDLGKPVVTLDNLSKGFRDAVLYGDLIVGDTGDSNLVRRVLEDYQVDTVIHFAALTIVPESVARPLKYYQNNTVATRNLIECCTEHGVQHFIFSSTAAVYGIPTNPSCDESDPVAPINPYGRSKLMSEMILTDACAVNDMRFAILRYFNVAGSDPSGRIGQATLDATLLIKVAAEVATGQRPLLTVYGTDYPTPDGTGIRDYIHVEDLADAHLRALTHLETGGASTTLNCGYGHGFSVRQVIDAVSAATDRQLPVIDAPRRTGDPPELIARADRLRNLCAWRPRFDNLGAIVRTSLDWERKLAALRAEGRWQGIQPML